MRNKVDFYLKDYSLEPLEFYEYNYKDFKYTYTPANYIDLDVKKLGLPTVIVKVLNYTQDLASGINGVIETESGRLRSSLDIWRHIKKYNPQTTIYEVMKCIADNWGEMNLYSHICCTIERRVFRIAEDSFDEDDDDYYDDPEYSNEINDEMEGDEYGLTFSEWSNL